MTIINRTTYQGSNIIEKLQTSSHEFYITGSWFFGGATPQSDFDYYCSSIVPTRFLRSLGFRQMDRYTSLGLDDVEIYHDKNIAEVWYNAEANIHIQIQNSIEAKHKAQEVMKILYPLWSKLSKSERVSFWNKAYRIIDMLDLTSRGYGG